MKENIAVIIPCYNEEITITNVINDFRSVIPNASIYVFDNNSTDNTYTLANEAGAILYKSPNQGKGNVIRHAFSVVEADIYIIADGDSQCEVSIIPNAISKFMDEKLDMLSLVRVSENSNTYRPAHKFGNKVLTGLVNMFFKTNSSDVLGGYRIFSKSFVKSFPSHSKGFEIEVELSVFAHQMRFMQNEYNVPYRSRPEGSFSKLNTVRDGILISYTIMTLFMTEKPILFFGIISFILGSVGLYLATDIYLEFLRISMVPRFPTFIFAMSLLFLSSLSLVTGIILHYIARNTLEQRRYTYNFYKNK